MGACLFKISRRFTTTSSCPIELKLVMMMILDMSPQYGFSAGFFVFYPGGAVWSCVLKPWNRFTAYSIDAIELKVGRISQDISPHKCSKPDFSIFLGGCGGAPLEIFTSIHSQSFCPIGVKLGGMVQNTSPHSRSEPDFPISLGALWREACRNFQVESQPKVFIWVSWNLVEWY